VKVQIDSSRCEGHARCFAIAPELFDIDDYGASSVRNDGDVPPDLEARARLAVANCPESAVSVVD
jgi:ferredoxin